MGTSGSHRAAKNPEKPSDHAKTANHGINSLMTMGIITKEKLAHARPSQATGGNQIPVLSRLPTSVLGFFWHLLGIPRRAVPWKGATRRCVLERIDS